jgi:hypothetical protein
MFRAQSAHHQEVKDHSVAIHELFLPKNPKSITANDNQYNKF